MDLSCVWYGLPTNLSYLRPIDLRPKTNVTSLSLKANPARTTLLDTAERTTTDKAHKDHTILYKEQVTSTHGFSAYSAKRPNPNFEVE